MGGEGSIELADEPRTWPVMDGDVATVDDIGRRRGGLPYPDPDEDGARRSVASDPRRQPRRQRPLPVPAARFFTSS